MATSKLMVAVLDSAALIKVQGRANVHLSLHFKHLTERLYSLGCKEIQVELTECVLMDSTFFGTLAVLARRHTQEQRPPICLWNAKTRIVDMLDNLGLKDWFSLRQGDVGELLKGSQVEGVDLSEEDGMKRETFKNSLEAHETLMALNQENVIKFKDFTDFLREDLKKGDK